MRLASTFAILALVFAATCLAEPPASGKHSGPNAETIIGVRGSGLEKLQQFGTPELVLAKRGKTPADDDVLFRYNNFILRVHQDTIKTCFIISEWKGTVRGIKMGDSREAVVKVLGKPRMVFKNKEGVETDYGYDLKDVDATLYANFDEEGKLKRVEIGAGEKAESK